MPHRAIVHDNRGSVTHFLQVEVLVGRRIGLNCNGCALGKVQGSAYLDGIVAWRHIFEDIDAIAQRVGHAALYLVAGGVKQTHRGVVDRHQIVIAVHKERLGALLEALDAVVAHIARHDSQVVIVQAVEVLVGSQRDVPAFHPAVVETQ